jgi:bifunctional non-homologous end joining protein LigD
MKLQTYRSKRNLKTSGEPAPKAKKGKKTKALAFVVQEHHARRLHYDLRLEAEGVLKSWAVPKEPSMDPSIKRLAIMVEDHPYAYRKFEGLIPSGYGAGTVSIWDEGTYSVDNLSPKESEKKIVDGLQKGVIHFSLHGKKLQGEFSLVRLSNSKKNEWLLIKKKSNDDSSVKKEEQQKNCPLTHLNKIFFPKDKITKGDLIHYYERIGETILMYLKDRPESLRRFPNGIAGGSFYQKNVASHPDWVQTIEIQHGEKIVHYLLIQDKETLLYAVNLGCIEFHPFFSRITSLHKPDFLVFDLDPKTASFETVIRVAQTIHETLDELGIPSFCKTSGATGLHIEVPLHAAFDYEVVKKFAQLLATMIHKKIPTITTLERSIAKRKGKVYIDYLQNNFAQTIAAPYCVRARPGAPVSTPLFWDEVHTGLNPLDYNIKTIFSRLEQHGDIFKPVLEKGIHIVKILKKLEQL